VLACAPPPEPGQPIVRVLDAAAEGRRVPLAERAPAVFAAREAESAAGWFTATWDGPRARIGDHPDGAAIDADGTPVLGPGSGVWVHYVELEPETDYVLEATLSGDGLTDELGPPFARLGLLELAERPTRPDDLAAYQHPDSAKAWGPEYPRECEGDRVTLWVTTAADTRAGAVLCLFRGADAEDGAPRPRAGVRFSDLVLRRALPRDRLAAILDDPERADRPTAVATGRFEVGLVTRPSVCVLPGGEVRLPVRVPEGPCALETWYGLVPAERDPVDVTPGTSLDLACALAAPGDDHLQELFAASVPAKARGEARWNRIRIDVPPGWSGREAELVLRAPGGEGAGPLPAGLFGGPRLLPERPARAGPNLVLVSIDTLRATELGCYGYPRATSPRIDALARESLLFTEVWASSCYTLPSHMSLFTGQQPSVHGVQDPFRRRDPDASRLLAEILYARGYSTGAFTGGAFVDPEFGFAAGFERYGVVDPVQNLDSEQLVERVNSFPGMTLELIREGGMDAVGRWLDARADESFFLFFHTYAAHEFDPPAEHRDALGIGPALSADAESLRMLQGEGRDPDERQRARLTDLYDGAVRQADAAVGALVDRLEALDLLEDTVLVVTSDHGKEIGEHGLVGHGHALYEELLRVPLLIRLPDRADVVRGTWRPGRSDEPAMLVDVVPTVLHALDLPLPRGVQGRSLLAPGPERTLLAEVDNQAVKYALLRGDLKTIYSPLDVEAFIANTVEEETFDLASDPAEARPLAPDPDRVREVVETFDALRELARALGGGAEASGLSETARGRLRALGYAEDADAVG